MNVNKCNWSPTRQRRCCLILLIRNCFSGVSGRPELFWLAPVCYVLLQLVRVVPVFTNDDPTEFSFLNLLRMTRIWTRIFTRWGSCTVLQNRASVITKWENFHITKQDKWNYKVGRVYKVGQLVLQKGETFITKWGWYC